MLKRTGWRSLPVYRERGPRMWWEGAKYTPHGNSSRPLLIRIRTPSPQSGPHPLPRYRGTEIPINRGRTPCGVILRLRFCSFVLLFFCLKTSVLLLIVWKQIRTHEPCVPTCQVQMNPVRKKTPQRGRKPSAQGRATNWERHPGYGKLPEWYAPGGGKSRKTKDSLISKNIVFVELNAIQL